ncbi:hypothetical protein ACFOLA_06505 [Salinicoccus hispanicus]|uniref:Uncharacterized protein n=1 Tax=Salinicoccus hispanicus TaxID=157225 RepID=A0A6N8U4L4_9STAP|nr:hypothetical protein [Salinicoccus hispanicus]MXQ51415.1 hypothetical protein [Salinicoccus hispanicus]
MPLSFFMKIHRRLYPTFIISPYITIPLLLIATLATSSFGHLLGGELFTGNAISNVPFISTLLLRIGILTIYVASNLLFLYFMIRWFRKKPVRILSLLSYYAVFATIVFVLSNCLFLLVTAIDHFFNMNEAPLLILFGISLVIIFTLLNLYPGYLFYLAIRHRPIDTFWPVILYIIGIHLITYTLLRLWNAVDIIILWNLDAVI